MNFNLFYISPELILTVGGILVLLIGLASRGKTTPEKLGVLSPEVMGMTVLFSSLVASVLLAMGTPVYDNLQFGGMIAVDGTAIFFKIIAAVSTIFVMFMSVDYFKRIQFHRGEYYALLIFAVLAINALAASTDLVMIYLSLEFLSLTSYILAGYNKRDPKSNEAAIKYFLYGSVAAAVMIYGMSMLYGLTGTTSILKIAEGAFTMEPGYYPVFLLSSVMVIAGFGFKIAMVPFHQWSPDTYEGAPTPITAFLSVASKAAGIAVLIRFLSTSVTPSLLNWAPLIIALSAITMTFGNLVAIVQTNIKRMLAYSSIAQAGYILVGVAAIPYSREAVPAILIYTFAYMFMNLGAFAVVSMMSSRLNSDDIEDYAGLVKRAPAAAAALFLFMLSLAGIPPTAGFIGKFYLFTAALQADNRLLLWLAILAIINTVISVFYYFNIVRVMFFSQPKTDEPVRIPGSIGAVLGLTSAMTLAVLIFPQPFISFVQQCANMLTYTNYF